MLVYVCVCVCVCAGMNKSCLRGVRAERIIVCASKSECVLECASVCAYVCKCVCVYVSAHERTYMYMCVRE